MLRKIHLVLNRVENRNHCDESNLSSKNTKIPKYCRVCLPHSHY